MGAVNAIATLAGCLPAVIWWACHRPNRLWWRYTGWSAGGPVPWRCCGGSWRWLCLRAISPPFLDFIESSGVTTQWSSLTEMLRGTDSWTPFVAPTATAGAPAGRPASAAILGTCLVAAAGLAGLAGPGMPARGRLVTMLLAGVVLMAAGYSGGLGSPLAHQVQAFLDAGGAPLRNVHKLGSVIRIPVVLGIAQVLGRVPLPGCVPTSVWLRAFAHPERDKRVAVAVVVLTALMVSTSLAWTGRLTPPGTFSAIPRYWHEAADWLDRTQHGDTGSPAGCWWSRRRRSPRRCGAPATTSRCRCSVSSPWGVRDSIPVPRRKPSGRWIRCNACSRPGALRWPGRYPCPPRHFLRGGAQRPGSRYVGARRAPSWCTAPSTDPRACRRWRSSAHRSGPARWRASSPTADCDRDTRPWKSTE